MSSVLVGTGPVGVSIFGLRESYCTVRLSHGCASPRITFDKYSYNTCEFIHSADYPRDGGRKGEDRENR